MNECRLFESPLQSVVPALADLSAVKAYLNYVAVTRVEPAGHHFTVWYHNIEPGMMRLRVQRDATGRLAIDVEGGYWGGLALPPPAVPPPPPEVVALARDLEAELRARCHNVRDWQIQYAGMNRTVTVEEFIAHDMRGQGTRRSGWWVETRIAMDESLTRIVGEVESWSGFGMIELPADAQWLVLPPSDGPRLFLVGGRRQELSQQIVEAARRYDSKAPGPVLATLVPADAPMLPPGFVSRVVAKVSLHARARHGPGSSHDLAARFNLREAVFGTGTSADAEVVLGGTHYRLHATLTPAAPRSPTSMYTSDTYAGTLTVHVEDDHGHAWDHTYPVSGKIDLEGDAVVAPYGLQIPGASSPSPEYDARHGQLSGSPPYDVVDLAVGVEMFDDPRQ